MVECFKDLHVEFKMKNKTIDNYIQPSSGGGAGVGGSGGTSYNGKTLEGHTVQPANPEYQSNDWVSYGLLGLGVVGVIATIAAYKMITKQMREHNSRNNMGVTDILHGHSYLHQGLKAQAKQNNENE